MIAGVPTLNIFGLTLVLERVDLAEQHAFVRCTVHSRRLQANTVVRLREFELLSLLEQVEVQYGDFDQSVTWRVGSEQNGLAMDWTLNTLGHAQGQYTLRSPHWRIEADLDGDQSYLAKMALGLRLIVRAVRGEPV